MTRRGRGRHSGLWLNQHTDVGEQIAGAGDQSRHRRGSAPGKVVRVRCHAGTGALPGELADWPVRRPGGDAERLFPVEGDSGRGSSAKQARPATSSRHAAASARSGRLGGRFGRGAGDRSGGARYIGRDRRRTLAATACRLRLRAGSASPADADSDGAHIATLLCAPFVRHFHSLVRQVYVRGHAAALFRVDVGKQVFYALGTTTKAPGASSAASPPTRSQGRRSGIQRLGGTGRDRPAAAARDDDPPRHRPAGAAPMVERGDGNPARCMDMLSWRQQRRQTARPGCRSAVRSVSQIDQIRTRRTSLLRRLSARCCSRSRRLEPRRRGWSGAGRRVSAAIRSRAASAATGEIAEATDDYRPSPGPPGRVMPAFERLSDAGSTRSCVTAWAHRTKDGLRQQSGRRRRRPQ